MHPKDEQMPRKYKGQGGMSPYDAFIDYYNEENQREEDTANAVKSKRSIKDIDREHKKTGKTLEVSGDAINRAKRNKPSKKGWDIAKDVWDSMSEAETAKYKK
jgi:hypothetical protein